MNGQIESWLKQYPAAKVIWPFAIVFVLLIGMNSMYGKKQEPPPSTFDKVLKTAEVVVEPLSGRVQQVGEVAGRVAGEALEVGTRTFDKGIQGYKKEPEENP